MSDTPAGSQLAGSPPSSTAADARSLTHLSGAHGPRRQHGNFPPDQSQVRQQPMHQHPQQSGLDALNMNALGTALPDVAYQNYNHPGSERYLSSPHGYQIPNAVPYVGMPMSPVAGSGSYQMPYQAPFQGAYPAGHGSQQMQPGTGSQFYHGPSYVNPQQQSNLPYYLPPGQYGLQGQGQMYAAGLSSAQFDPRGNYPGDNRPSSLQRPNEQLAAGLAGAPGRPSSNASSTGQPTVVRGPPRKPRQSGHAIWIGNLPPQTELMNLVLHVCKETAGLESLFLISKSNCAFANYKDEAACAAAQLKIHDSRFQNVRLVSRLRRTTAVSPTGGNVPTGPAALTPPSAATAASTPSPGSEPRDTELATEGNEVQEGEAGSSPKDKYFVVKSLTVEDLELSVRNGIWATQAHNEEALSKAYEAADNVYLIFSANKSGEYFGYARMSSRINDDPAAAIEFAPKAQAVDDPDLPKAIPTPATEFAPRGRIIDDSARGTIFWEADREDNDEADDDEERRSNRSDQDDSPSPSKAWGKPFKVEWLSTTRLPFYRTRGLRNPWNSNREVKIARDGTELETAVGRRLLSLFHRLPSPNQMPPVAPMPGPGLFQGGAGGYGGQMRAPF